MHHNEILPCSVLDELEAGAKRVKNGAIEDHMLIGFSLWRIINVIHLNIGSRY